MKRLISLIMSVLMIATMFCGFAVTSTAADSVANITIEAGEVQEDGTVEIKVWVKDNTPYGVFAFGFYVDYDETKLTPVTYKTATYGMNGFLEVSPMSAYVDFMYSQKANTSAAPVIACMYDAYKEGRTTKGYYAINDEGGNFLSLGSSTDAMYGYSMGWSDTYFDTWGVNASSLTIDADKGLLWATAKFTVNDGASGSAEITAIPEICQLARDDDSSGAHAFDEVAKTRVSATPAYVDLGSDEPEAPELPEGITMSVSEDVSIRTADPAGMRFVANVTATDFSVIDEMGVAIVKNGEVPGVGKTLKIPARVDMSGNYLHQYIQDETGAITGFVPGITATGSATYSGVLSNIKDANRSVNFDAYAYVVIDGNVFYSDACETENYNNILGLAEGDDTIAE